MIEVLNVENVVGGLDQVSKNLADMTTTMIEVNESLEAYHRKNWGRGVKDVPGTLQRHPDSDGKLDETGALKASLTDSGADGAIRRVTPHTATFGTSLWYANFSQKGTPKEKRKPTLRFNTNVKKLMRTIIYANVWKATERLHEGSPD